MKGKHCSTCGQTKSITEFYKCKGKKDGLTPDCKDCNKARVRQWAIDNPEKYRSRLHKWREKNREYINKYARDHYGEGKRESNRLYRLSHKSEEATRQRRNNLRRKYRIIEADYQAMLVAQGGQCKICGAEKPGGRGNYFHVDHNHEYGDIRGLLCSRCNLVIGLIDDNVDIAIKIIICLDPPVS